MKFLFSMIPVFFLFISIQAQVLDVNELEKENLNWYNADLETDKMTGASIDKLYQTLLAERSPKKEVVVAVLDSGVDIEHEDLQGQIWINEDEMPGNGIDDDNNGYVDDVHGWNFLGNANGENLNLERYEFTRVLSTQNVDDPNYARSQELWDAEYEKRHKEKENLRKFQEYYIKARQIVKEGTGIEVNSEEDLDRVNSADERVLGAKQWLQRRYDMGFTEDDLNEMIHRNDKYMKYYLNKTIEPRELVGDDPDDISDVFYGNPDVIGPRADHGTSVAGVIAAVRDNDIGIDGVAANVKIMVVRIVPDGDERDKDIALGIRYAVDNGADIINMSFGKQITTHKEWVDEAVKYAAEKNVLLIHAAGNYGFNIDEEETYPSDRFLNGTDAINFFNVGAHSKMLDKKFLASFSNYGQNHVDIFAPGVDIISCDTSSHYSQHNGTSVAAPVTTGVAAIILAYFPEIKPGEMIAILVDGSNKFRKPKKVFKPGLDEKRKKEKFAKLSVSGGILDAYTAFLVAIERFED